MELLGVGMLTDRVAILYFCWNMILTQFCTLLKERDYNHLIRKYFPLWSVHSSQIPSWLILKTMRLTLLLLNQGPIVHQVRILTEVNPNIW